MSSKKLCKYTKECAIYKGVEEAKNMSVWMYKNVFCTRGERGWLGCEKYIEYESLVKK